MREDGTRSPQKTLFSVAVLLLCLLTMVLLCVGALHVLLRQGQEVEVSVETSGEQFTESVTVTLRNVLGMDILIDEQENSCAMLQRRVGDTWENVSEIRFVQEDSAALSAKYGGMYAHLAPGGELLYELDGEQINSLPGGEYRIAIRYISEKAYADYLNARAKEIETSLDAALLLNSSGDPSDTPSDDPSADTSDHSSGSSGNNSGSTSDTTSGDVSAENPDNTSGNSSGTTSDNNPDNTSGNPSENNHGNPSGNASGNTPGSSGNTPDDISGTTPGDPSGNTSVDPSDTTPADTPGNTSGTSADTSSDTSNAPTPSVLPETELLYAEFVIIPRSPQPAP